MVAAHGPRVFRIGFDPEALWRIRIERDLKTPVLSAVTGAGSKDAVSTNDITAKGASSGAKIPHHRVTSHPWR
jgi:hypothetical protein